MLRGKRIAVNAYTKKGDISQINNVTLYFKETENSRVNPKREEGKKQRRLL